MNIDFNNKKTRGYVNDLIVGKFFGTIRKTTYN